MEGSFLANIAGKTIKLELPVLPLADNWKPFLVENGITPIFLSIQYAENPLARHFHGVSFYTNRTNQRIAYSSSDPNTAMFYDEDWQHIITYGALDISLFELLITALYSRLTFVEQAMLLHASFVKHKGEAIVFIGPSGIGKTTQAELWHKTLRADIINGDKAFASMKDQTPYIYGSPWSGSSPYYANDSAPLKAIILLEQGPTNKIQKLTGLHAFSALLKHTFIPRWEKRCTEHAMQMIDTVLQSAPIYFLSCKPTEEAVQLTYRTIWGE